MGIILEVSLLKLLVDVNSIKFITIIIFFYQADKTYLKKIAHITIYQLLSIIFVVIFIYFSLGLLFFLLGLYIF